MDLDYWDHTLDNGWFGVIWFHDLSHIWCHTRAYSVSVEIYGSSWSRTIISTYEIRAETRTCSLFYYDPPVEPLLSHLVRPIFFQHLYAIMLLILGDVSLTFEFVLGYGDHRFDDGWFHVTQFSAYHISGAMLGHIPFRMRFMDLHGLAWSSPITRYTSRWWHFLLSYHDPLVEPLLSYPVRPVFFSICMSSCFFFWGTFQWCLGLFQLWVWMIGIT